MQSHASMLRRTPSIACLIILCACGGGASPTDAGPDAPDARAVCSADDACDNGLFCDGVERCRPDDPRADTRGCVRTRRCVSGQTCDEAADLCRTQCSVANDADGDGHDAIECGGDDCDDSDADAFPGNVERCDLGHDEDCDPTTFGEKDADGDGAIDALCCNVDGSGMRCGTDCDDTSLARRPLQLEICDGVDNDCDDEIDEDTSAVDWFEDADGDGFGASGSAMRSCSPLAGRSLLATDCDDTRRDVSPVASERCNGFDDDCDGQIDEGCGATDAGVDSSTMDAGTMDAGTMDASLDAGTMDASLDASSGAFSMAETCAAGGCATDRRCLGHLGATPICHDDCASDADCDRGRTCVFSMASGRYCSHPCDALGQTGCPGTEACDISTLLFEPGDGGPTSQAYLECRPLGGATVGGVCSIPRDCGVGLTCAFQSGGQVCQTLCRVGFGAECTGEEHCCPWGLHPSDAAGREIGRCKPLSSPCS